MTNIKILDDLRELLKQGSAGSQEEICSALIKKNHDVNQSKVSRMLRKIGAVKAKNEFGQIVYRISKEPAPPTSTSLLLNLIIDISCNETMIVIATSPGSAPVISRLLDYHRETAGILGTIAGDDTIIVIPRSIRQTKALMQKVKAILLTSKLDE